MNLSLPRYPRVPSEISSPCWLPVWPNTTINIGRDSAGRNDLAFSSSNVSRGQLEIYSITAEEDERRCPLVFVRDRQSCNGTYVNGQLIGKEPKPSSAHLLQDGDVINLFKDRYIITDRTIGDGAHAVVYLGTDAKTQHQVVCKVQSLISRRARSHHAILWEAHLLSLLDHPNILSIKAAFQTRENMYIVTELAAGGDLFSVLSRYQVLKEFEVWWIIRQVVSAVWYIHIRGVAHRDIKLENILCTTSPKATGRIALADFGDSAPATRRRRKSEVGTRMYQAPELSTPAQGHGLSVDIWAIGILTLQLFMGAEDLPEAERLDLNSQDKVNRYLDSNFDRVSRLARISENGKLFIRACLVCNSEDRLTAAQASEHF
ncbi:kinase-like domain-containing protein [Bombardia bombarda]|uniref:Kinase-like domain-containing protein n=1 Tax=Bombardia bombarda TaxID=252184 RepID=A0AA39WTB4_9PEZI|nr:kinase-like domain-containing protein [Bombardia bombarda]